MPRRATDANAATPVERPLHFGSAAGVDEFQFGSPMPPCLLRPQFRIPDPVLRFQMNVMYQVGVSAVRRVRLEAVATMEQPELRTADHMQFQTPHQWRDHIIVLDLPNHPPQAARVFVSAFDDAVLDPIGPDRIGSALRDRDGRGDRTPVAEQTADGEAQVLCASNLLREQPPRRTHVTCEAQRGVGRRQLDELDPVDGADLAHGRIAGGGRLRSIAPDAWQDRACHDDSRKIVGPAVKTVARLCLEHQPAAGVSAEWNGKHQKQRPVGAHTSTRSMPPSFARST